MEPTLCTRCGNPTRDTVRRLHGACREPSGVVVGAPFPSRIVQASPPPPPPPKIEVEERPVGIGELPRGPKAVAKAVDFDAWNLDCYHSRAEELRNPARGGEAFGLRFISRTGAPMCWGWALWLRGKFEGAYLYEGASMVPTKLTAKELKGVLSHG